MPIAAQQPKIDTLPGTAATITVRGQGVAHAVVTSGGATAHVDTVAVPVVSTFTVPRPAPGASVSPFWGVEGRYNSLKITSPLASLPPVVVVPPPVVVTPPPPVSSGLYAHEPAGFGRIAEIAFDAELPSQLNVRSGSGIRAGCWQRYGWGGAAQIVGGTDASAPISGPGVNVYTWPAGLQIGNSAGKLDAWACPGNGSAEYRGVYESGWIKLAGSSFESPGPGMKLLGFWGAGRADNGRVSNEVYSMIPGGVRSAFTLDIREQGPVSRSMQPNVNGAALIVVGRWVRYEILMTINDVGAANGTLKVWIDGTATHDYRDVVWRTAAAPAGFYGRSFNPIWGGNGTQTKSKTDALVWDHLYISGAR